MKSKSSKGKRKVRASRTRPVKKPARKRVRARSKVAKRKPAKRKPARKAARKPAKRKAARKPARKLTRKPAKRKSVRKAARKPAKRKAVRKPARKLTRKPARRKVTRRKTVRKTAARRTAARRPAKRRPSVRKAGRNVVVRRPEPRTKKGPAVRPPFEAYKGTKSYIFTSYSHGDMREVFNIIRKLNDERFRVWYDEGIEPGVEWPEVVGKAILRSRQFMVFMSPSAVNSRNVRNEINLAHSESKNILVIFLRATRLSEGMKLQIGTVQHLNRFEMTEREFLGKLARVLASELRN